MFNDGVAAVEDDVELTAGIDFDAFDHLADGVVVVFTATVSEAFDASLQLCSLFKSFRIRFSGLTDCFQPFRELGDLVGEVFETLLVFFHREVCFQSHIDQCHQLLVEHTDLPYQQVGFITVLVHADGITDGAQHDGIEVFVVIATELAHCPHNGCVQVGFFDGG